MLQEASTITCRAVGAEVPPAAPLDDELCTCLLLRERHDALQGLNLKGWGGREGGRGTHGQVGANASVVRHG